MFWSGFLSQSHKRRDAGEYFKRDFNKTTGTQGWHITLDSGDKKTQGLSNLELNKEITGHS